MSFHEVSYGAYNFLVCDVAIKIALQRGVDVIDAFALDSPVRREAVDRLYVLGTFHDLMIRWPKKEAAAC